MNFLFVGVGGALGAALRYGISSIPVKTDFPVWTLLINIIAAVVIGFFAGLTVRKNMPEELRLFVQTGFCGGFTTFSTFSLDNLKLIENGRYAAAALNAALSVTLCLAAAWLGKTAAVAAMR